MYLNFLGIGKCANHFEPPTGCASFCFLSTQSTITNTYLVVLQHKSTTWFTINRASFMYLVCLFAVFHISSSLPFSSSNVCFNKSILENISRRWSKKYKNVLHLLLLQRYQNKATETNFFIGKSKQQHGKTSVVQAIWELLGTVEFFSEATLECKVKWRREQQEAKIPGYRQIVWRSQLRKRYIYPSRRMHWLV